MEKFTTTASAEGEKGEERNPYKFYSREMEGFSVDLEGMDHLEGVRQVNEMLGNPDRLTGLARRVQVAEEMHGENMLFLRNNLNPFAKLHDIWSQPGYFASIGEKAGDTATYPFELFFDGFAALSSKMNLTVAKAVKLLGDRFSNSEETGH